MMFNKFLYQKRMLEQLPLGNRRSEMLALKTKGLDKNEFNPVPQGQKQILWKCMKCEELKPRENWGFHPCVSCGAPVSQFVLVDGD